MTSRSFSNFLATWVLVACWALSSIAFADHSSTGGLAVLEEVEKGLTGLAEHTLPAVVNLSPYVPESPSVGNKDSIKSRPTNAGAGVIIDGAKGYIITNAHVVKQAEQLLVTLYKGEELIGRVLGTDEETDLAVVQVDSETPLPQVRLGDSSRLKIGQLVVAIGNPYGLHDTLSFGVISGLNRENINLSRYEDFIQTDASINPGNSGGPLLNIRGEVIGINTAIINYAQSIGFAIPSNVVKNVSRQIVESGIVSRGWLGVGIENVPEDLALKSNLEKGKGVLVNSVFEDQPADQGGIKVGDIILKIAGSPVNSPNGMIRLIGNISPGQFVELNIIRNGESETFSVMLGRRKEMQDLASLNQFPVPELGFEWAENIQEPSLEGDSDKKKDGVLVTRVEPGSVADHGGLMVGDQITAINGKDVLNHGHFEVLLKQNFNSETLAFVIQRSGESVVLTLNQVQ